MAGAGPPSTTLLVAAREVVDADLRRHDEIDAACRNAVADAGAGAGSGGDPGTAAGPRHAVAVAARRHIVPAPLASVRRPGKLRARTERSGILGEPGQFTGLGDLCSVTAVRPGLRHRAAAEPQLRVARRRAGTGGSAVGAAVGDHRTELDLDARFQPRRAE